MPIYILIARNRETNITDVEKLFSSNFKTALRFSENKYPRATEHEALLCRCENNGDLCEACQVFDIYSPKGVQATTATQLKARLAELQGDGFYRPTAPVSPRITVTDTPEDRAGASVYEADNCEHCHASYGHIIACPLLNREVAEIRSRFANPTEGDKIQARGLGVIL